MKVITLPVLVALLGTAVVSAPAAADRFYTAKHHSDRIDHRKYGHHTKERWYGTRRDHDRPRHRRHIDPHPTLRPHITLQLGSVSYRDGVRIQRYPDWHRPRFSGEKAYRRGYHDGYREGYRDARRKHHRSRRH